MGKKYDVVALGELLIDFTGSGMSAQGNGLFEACPGGAPCNVLAMLNRLGRKTAFIGKVGEDMFGNLLRDCIKEAGVEVSGLVMDRDVRTTLAFVKTFKNGDRDFSFYRNPGADMMLDPEDVRVDIIRDTRIFHFGTLSMTHDTVREATKKAVVLAKEAGALISFDPNLREPLWDSLDNANEQISWGLSRCDILKIADNETVFVTGCRDLIEGGKILLKDYPNIKILNITAGGDGSYSFYTGSDPVFVPACKRGGVIETTGAGDTFCACVNNYVLDHGTDGLKDSDRYDMLRYANTAAYIVTTRKGAIKSMPTPEEIEAALNA